MAEQLDMDGLIEYLKSMLGNRFSKKISRIYYGDVVTYLPSAFLGPNKEQHAILVIQPTYNRLIPDERVVAFENRLLGVDIIGLVNITSEFNADPKAAYGEKQLVQLITEIATFLTQETNVNLQERVQFSRVLNIDWHWLPKGDLAIRGAALEYEVRVRIPRI